MLSNEIKRAQRLVRTDAYQMSIGEVVNMYKDGELVVDPEFQRLFRWDVGQKSRLFESILLGIPLPSIFVFEKEDATWELIDGLQRTSTILEFMGLLVDAEGEKVPPSSLEGTKYLPSLHNAVWQESADVPGLPVGDQSPFDSDQKLAVRRSRIAVEILKRPSDNNTKYDLFQRLNAGGTPANAQELRNCVIIMANRNFFNELKDLSEIQNFRDVTAMTEDQIEKQRPLELVSRLFVHAFVPYDGKTDVEEFINVGVLQLAEEGLTNRRSRAFSKTFEWLNEAHGADSLRRFHEGQPRGKVSLAAFELIAVGIASNASEIERLDDPVAFIVRKIAELWGSDNSEPFFSAGMRGTTRIQRTVPYGKKWFSVNETA